MSDANETNAPVIKLKEERELRLKKSLEAGRPEFISSASGVVAVGERLYVVSDDENSLFHFKTSDRFITQLLFSNTKLPVEKEDRKRLKLDHEAILFLNSQHYPPHGAILAWPSGSTSQRNIAILSPIGADGAPKTPLKKNVTSLHASMLGHVKDLNIEGVAVAGQNVYFFQRGNSSEKSGRFEMAVRDWIQGLKSEKWKGSIKYKEIEFGTLHNVKLSVTDAISTPHGLIGLATAENTASSYSDGTVFGSVLVNLAGDTPKIIAKFEPVSKLEGLSIKSVLPNGDISFYAVDDSDNSAIPSRLYTFELNPRLISTTK